MVHTRSNSAHSLVPVSSALKRQTSDRPSSKNPFPKPSVRFEYMEVHEFPQILGDNPGVTAGAPLTLDWEPVAQYTVLIDYYEFTRDPPRTKKQLMDSVKKRHHYLLKNGVEQEEIDETCLAIDKIKKDRLASSLGKNQTWDGFVKVMQTAAKTVTVPSKLLISTSTSAAARIIPTAKKSIRAPSA